MPGTVIITGLNQYRFVPLNEALSDNYNNKPYHSTLFNFTRKYWQLPTKYLQKVQTADWMRIQIWTGYDTSPATPEVAEMLLRLYTCRGVEIGDPLVIPRLPVAGFPDENGNLIYVNGFVSKTYWEDALTEAGVDEGEFHFILEVPFTDTDAEVPGIDYFVSEPIHVKAKHPKTMLIEVSNSVNRDNCVFQQTYWKWSWRIEGTVLVQSPQTDRVVFKDQGSNSKQLSATVYNKPVLSIGYNRPIPFWCIEKANHYLACNNIYIDTVGYSTVEGSQLVPEQPDNNFPFYQANMDLGDKDNNQNFEFSGKSINLFLADTIEPFFIGDLRLGVDNINTAFFETSEMRIGSDADLETWIADMNAGILVEGLEGIVEIVDGWVVFTPTPADRIYFGEVTILYGRLGLLMTTTVDAESIPLTIGLGGITDTYVAVCLPDGSTADAAFVSATPDYFTLSSYVAPTAGVQLYELFHDRENLNYIDINSTKISGIQDFSIDNNVPPRLRSFRIRNSTKLTSFNAYADLANCRDYLFSLQLDGNTNLDEVNLYTPATGLPGAPGWLILQNVLLNNNSISVANVDAIYNDTRQAHLALQWLVYNGAITTANQSPAAVPTAASGPARLSLGPTSMGGTYNWVIIATP